MQSASVSHFLKDAVYCLKTLVRILAHCGLIVDTFCVFRKTAYSRDELNDARFSMCHVRLIAQTGNQH